VLLRRDEAEVEEVAKQCHGRLHAHERLTREGKCGKESDRVGVEVESLDLVMLQDRQEEGRERRHQAHQERVDEEGIVGGGEIDVRSRSHGNVGGALLIGIGANEAAHLLQPFLVANLRTLQGKARA
jgi:hypothetical protein